MNWESVIAIIGATAIVSFILTGGPMFLWDWYSANRELKRLRKNKP